MQGKKTGRSADWGFRLTTGAIASLLVVIVCAIAAVLVRDSWTSIQRSGFAFWHTQAWDPRSGEFGALPFIWGTLYSSVLALALATPIALGVAVFTSELAPPWLRQPLAFLTDLLAAMPSIVYGLWGLFVLVPAVARVEASLPDAIRELLKTVPAAQREAAYALGATRFEAIRAALFYARTGIIAAIMLGFGRALGETMAVTMVIGNIPGMSLSMFAPHHTMSAVIANEFAGASAGLYRSALVEIGLVLFVVTLAVNSLSRLLIWTMSRKISPVPA